jgi:hypothetical protein
MLIPSKNIATFNTKNLIVPLKTKDKIITKIGTNMEMFKFRYLFKTTAKDRFINKTTQR